MLYFKSLAAQDLPTEMSWFHRFKGFPTSNLQRVHGILHPRRVFPGKILDPAKACVINWPFSPLKNGDMLKNWRYAINWRYAKKMAIAEKIRMLKN